MRILFLALSIALVPFFAATSFAIDAGLLAEAETLRPVSVKPLLEPRESLDLRCLSNVRALQQEIREIRTAYREASLRARKAGEKPTLLLRKEERVTGGVGLIQNILRLDGQGVKQLVGDLNDQLQRARKSCIVNSRRRPFSVQDAVLSSADALPYEPVGGPQYLVLDVNADRLLVEVLATEISFGLNGIDLPVRLNKKIYDDGVMVEEGSVFGGYNATVVTVQANPLELQGDIDLIDLPLSPQGQVDVELEARAAYPDFDNTIYTYGPYDTDHQTNSLMVVDGEHFMTKVIDAGYVEAFGDQNDILAVVAEHIDVDGNVTGLGTGGMLILYELGTLNTAHPAFDLQDLVLLVKPTDGTLTKVHDGMPDGDSNLVNQLAARSSLTNNPDKRFEVRLQIPRLAHGRPLNNVHTNPYVTALSGPGSSEEDIDPHTNILSSSVIICKIPNGPGGMPSIPSLDDCRPDGGLGPNVILHEEVDIGPSDFMPSGMTTSFGGFTVFDFQREFSAVFIPGLLADPDHTYFASLTFQFTDSGDPSDTRGAFICGSNLDPSQLTLEGYIPELNHSADLLQETALPLSEVLGVFGLENHGFVASVWSFDYFSDL